MNKTERINKFHVMDYVLMTSVIGAFISPLLTSIWLMVFSRKKLNNPSEIAYHDSCKKIFKTSKIALIIYLFVWGVRLVFTIALIISAKITYSDYDAANWNFISKLLDLFNPASFYLFLMMGKQYYDFTNSDLLRKIWVIGAFVFLLIAGIGAFSLLTYGYHNEFNFLKDVTKSFSYIKNEAENGNAQAQFDLGGFYLRAGAQQDYITAFYWTQKAAEQGVADAQYNLGNLYYEGKGVQQDYNKAVYWTQKAAEQGVADAQYNLALFYYEGEGIQKDNTKAFYWSKKAVLQGNLLAINTLGYFYEKGIGVKKDIAEAIKYYKQAIRDNNPNAQQSLGKLYRIGLGVEKNYSKAFQLSQLSYNSNNDFCSANDLGVLNAQGKGVTTNYDEAYKLFNFSALKVLNIIEKEQVFNAQKDSQNYANSMIELYTNKDESKKIKLSKSSKTILNYIESKC